MARLQELQEAKEKAQVVLKSTDEALNFLKSASNWSLFDLLGGEGITSLMKRSKIKKANKEIERMTLELEELRKELKDVDISLPLEISDTMEDNFFDVFFDNIFTDLRVNGEIKKKLAELRDFRQNIEELIQRLDQEININ
ncbi:hypothetical protein [Anaerococcus tetradius]|jgi:hypothetical protein|uniref:Uncharacterized protein n=1 Tax=Anaerococcus tetradius ATCC 35098 TaxID=525255 RepID=C2CKC0_9FIRM|nr:hypothetical protein [Anaerococcus tetradius]EEI82051.1 hypothetical protein HMPREF0077_1930 [Anaerococcus tetradius ATCC 35098]